MDDVEKAVGSFRDGFSCSQAVLGTHAERHGMPRNLALRLADSFGAGMGGLGKTCGAVTGAMMVIGLAHGRTEADDAASKMATATRVRKLVALFEARHGTIACRELIGCDLDTPEKVRQARERGLFASVCTGLVRSAAEILDQVLAE
jgi:C_GCAxxG_C_C family probable redox protein